MNEEIHGKYGKLTRDTVAAERQSAIEKAIFGIDTLSDINQLIALLTPAVQSLLN